MDKIKFDKFKQKRQLKSPKFSPIATRQELNTYIGQYVFDNWGLTSVDVSDVDFSNLSLEDMTHLAFSSTTKFGNKLPQGYNPEQILKQSISVGKNISKIHNQGINGEGIIVAVIDSGFQAENHIEFKGINLIRATNSTQEFEYHHHIENVLCKLCGKNLGVAPKSKVIYYETSMDEDLSYESMLALQDIINRINNGEEIRAVSCSFSILNDTDKHYKECLSLIKELKQLNCEVVDSVRFGENYFCCGTDFLNITDDSDKYKVCSFAKGKSWENECKQNVNIVCSGRAVLEFCNDNGYKYEVVDCFSWTIPQLVGIYCLALQIDKSLDFDTFTQIVVKTSKVNKNGLRVIDEINLIKEIELMVKKDITNDK